jgi:hypothetical protein
MPITMKIPILVGLVVGCWLALPVGAKTAQRNSSRNLAPGTYHDWGNDFDEVVILRPLKAAAALRIDIAPINYEGVRLPDENDNTYRAVKEVLANSMKPYLKGLQEKLASAIRAQVGGSGKPPALLLRTRISRIDPGSQAARYWAGFSAGAVIVEMTGEISDERTKTVLITFRQERRSGFGVFGGGYHALLDRTIKQIGGDVAGLLNAVFSFR